MAQGEFTREEVRETKIAVEEMFEALSKSKRREYLGHLNDIFLFLNAAMAVAPSEQEATPPGANGR